MALDADMKLCLDETDSVRDLLFSPSSFNCGTMLAKLCRFGVPYDTVLSVIVSATELAPNELLLDPTLVPEAEDGMLSWPGNVFEEETRYWLSEVSSSSTSSILTGAIELC